MERVLADLAWWFKWSPSDLWDLDMVDVDMWFEQMNRQVKAGYGRVL